MNEIVMLRDLVDELQEGNRQLREELGVGCAEPNHNKRRGYGMTQDHLFILTALWKQKFCRTEFLLMQKYGDGRDEPQFPLRTLRVQITQLRGIVRPYRIEIKNAHGRGYYVPDESRGRLDALMRDIYS